MLFSVVFFISFSVQFPSRYLIEPGAKMLCLGVGLVVLVWKGGSFLWGAGQNLVAGWSTQVILNCTRCIITVQ